MSSIQRIFNIYDSHYTRKCEMSEVLFLCERDLIESFSNLTKIPNIYMTFPGHTVSNVQGMDGHETP